MIKNISEKVCVRHGSCDLRQVRIYDKEDRYLFSWECADWLMADSPLKYINTSISKQIYDIIRVCHTKDGLSIVSGDAEIRKTKAINKYASNHPTNSFVITMNPCMTGVKTLLSIIADAIGSEHPYLIPKLYSAIQNRLSDGMILIFDEAQHMTLKDIEVLRSFSDYFDNIGQTLGICFVGNPETIYRMGVKKAEFAQIANRAKQMKIYSTSDIKRSDIENSINYLYEAGYLHLRHTESKQPTSLADTDFDMIEGKLTAKGIQLLAGVIQDECVEI